MAATYTTASSRLSRGRWWTRLAVVGWCLAQCCALACSAQGSVGIPYLQLPASDRGSKTGSSTRAVWWRGGQWLECFPVVAQCRSQGGGSGQQNPSSDRALPTAVDGIPTRSSELVHQGEGTLWAGSREAAAGAFGGSGRSATSSGGCEASRAGGIAPCYSSGQPRHRRVGGVDTDMGTRGGSRERGNSSTSPRCTSLGGLYYSGADPSFGEPLAFTLEAPTTGDNGHGGRCGVQWAPGTCSTRGPLSFARVGGCGTISGHIGRLFGGLELAARQREGTGSDPSSQGCLVVETGRYGRGPSAGCETGCQAHGPPCGACNGEAAWDEAGRAEIGDVSIRWPRCNDKAHCNYGGRPGRDPSRPGITGATGDCWRRRCSVVILNVGWSGRAGPRALGSSWVVKSPCMQLPTRLVGPDVATSCWWLRLPVRDGSLRSFACTVCFASSACTELCVACQPRSWQLLQGSSVGFIWCCPVLSDS